MHIIHIKESSVSYDCLMFYTKNPQEVDILNDLSDKIFGDRKNVAIKNEQVKIYILYDFYKDIPEDCYIFPCCSNDVEAYDPRFLNDKKLAKEVAETTIGERIRIIAEFFADENTQVNIESFVQYDTKESTEVRKVSVTDPICATDPVYVYISTPTGLSLT